MAKTQKKRILRPPQHQSTQPGKESKMVPEPIYDDPMYLGSKKLQDKVVVITGGDSGIGRAVSLACAKEGADVAILYLNEEEDAKKTQALIEAYGGRALLIAGDIGSEAFCKRAVEKVKKAFGKIDVLINNAAEQQPQETIQDISGKQLEQTFRTNIFSMFYLVKAVLPHLEPGSSIVNTTSVTAYRGSGHLLDYAATKGAIVAFTRSLSEQLVEKKIRVNAVAPGPIWTPLIPSTFDAQHVSTFGSDVPMKRAGQPFEVAPSYIFLASSDSSYMTGQVLHPNGGEIVNT